jgi:uncharacterized protein (TIGR02246 family)
MTTMLEDKDAIRELLAEYCFHLDAGNYAEMAALFTDDGTWDTAFGKGTGHEGIVAQATRIAQQSTSRPRRVHLVTNIVIRLDGDRAQVASNWVVVENNTAGPRIGSAGGYADDLVKRDGAWFFRYRKIDRFIAPGRM